MVEGIVREPLGFTVQIVATPGCRVQEIGLVVEAWVDVNIIFMMSIIVPVNALKTEFFSTRLAAWLNVVLRDLKREFFSARPEDRVNALARVRDNEFFSATPEPTDSDPVPALKIEVFSGPLDAVVNEAERDLEYATFPLRSTSTATHAELADRHSVFVSEVLPVLSNPELVILALEPPEAMRVLSLPTRPVVQSPAFPRQLKPATAKSPAPEVVRTTLGAALEPVLIALLSTFVTPLYTRTTSEFLPPVPPVKDAVTV